MLPVMTMVFNFVGLVGGYLVTVVIYNVDFGHVSDTVPLLDRPDPLWQGAHQGRACSASPLALAACYQGFNVRGGAKEVGRATTRAVVVGSVSVLVLDFFLPHPHGAIRPFVP